MARTTRFVSTRKIPMIVLACAAAQLLGLITTSAGATDITFSDIAIDKDTGIDYRRGRSDRYAIIESIQQAGEVTAGELPFLPLKSNGAPGVVLFDYDRDGDLDIYVTNGPRRANSLYANQFSDTGAVEFIDLGVAAGVAATASDSTGACAGDIDNDGDEDLLVLAFNAAHSLFRNEGDGSFADISASAQLAWDAGAMSCAMGDVNGDSLLDIAIANVSNLENALAFFADAFAFNTHNQLFLNMGRNEFSDASVSCGVQALANVPIDAATLSWAVSIVDIDLDGDQDIVFADDQAGLPDASQGGVDRGFIQLLENDGSGHFSSRVASSTGLWMGLAISDLNCDGHLDIFGSNFGDYGFTPFNPNYQLGDMTSRWLLGNADGSFDDPGAGVLIATPFGWGASSLDYDNDGDTDLLFHGGMDLITAIEQSNAGALLRNDGCSANFTRDTDALLATGTHTNRIVQGMAVGDLNNDGFVDIVTVSSADVPASASKIPYDVAYGSSFDADAVFSAQFATSDGVNFRWVGTELEEGTLTIEINSGNNGNGWVAAEVMGTVGLVDGATVNRGGIGAVVSFTPRKGPTAMQPVLAGSSYASQDSLISHFGLGAAPNGVIEVLWPGGVRNRLYGVRGGESVLIPEIPCSFDAPWKSVRAYRQCVSNAISQLVADKVISAGHGLRLRSSALHAFWSHR